MPHADSTAGLEAVYVANTEALVRFLRARGAGDAAEDLVQELWIKLSTAQTGPIASPLAYLYRAVNLLMIDRYRSQRQASRREVEWTAANLDEGGRSEAPLPDRGIAARQAAALVADALDGLEPHPRVANIFRLHRVDGIGQRAIAEQLGVSVSTVESDLRKAYRALIALRERIDEE